MMGTKSQRQTSEEMNTKPVCKRNSNLKSDFLCSGANKVVEDRDKVTLMSYEKCQQFAIVSLSSLLPLLTKERRINFPLNNFQFPRLLFSPFDGFAWNYQPNRECRVASLLLVFFVSSTASSSRMSMNSERIIRKNSWKEFRANSLRDFLDRLTRDAWIHWEKG